MRSSLLDILLFAAYTLFSVVGLLLVRAWLGEARTEWLAGEALGWPAVLAFLGASFYVAAFLLWMAILTRYEVSLAYPIAIGLTLLLLSLGSTLLLAEKLSPSRIGGMALILIGVALVMRS